MGPDDLTRLVTISDPHLHPDGVRVAFAVSRMDLEADRYHKQLWLWDGAQARPFTHGPADMRPRWSPDGTRLAFLRGSGEEGKPPQVAVMPASGGEASLVTSFSLGALEAEWSPDGSRLAVIGVEWAGEWAGLDEEERKRHPRRITHPGYRLDDLGWLHDRRANVYLIDGGEPLPLSQGEFHDSSLAWRPDGKALGFLSARHEERDLDGANQAWEVPVEGGEPRPLTAPGRWHSLAYRPDGAPYLVGIVDPWDWPAVSGLWRLDGTTLIPVAAGLDRSFAPGSPAVAPDGPQWLADGSGLWVIEDRNRNRVIRIGPAGEVSDVLDGDRAVTGLAACPDGAAFAFTATSAVDPGELWWWEAGEERRLTELNAAFRHEAALVAPEPFTVSSDGVEIDAWAYLPPGEGSVPLLLNIHGGPATQYGYRFFDEFQVYASAGYGVIACNPRGSSGRGRDFVRVPVGRWVEERPPDLEDILAVVEAALERFPRLDRERLGIMGGSYGGYMTACILTVDHRFRSAVPERGVYSYTSFSGTSDIGLRFPRMYLDDHRYGEWERLWAASPLARADRIDTPCLILHSEGDARCPIEQGEQLFAALAANRVEVEMLRFPGASHELSRSGKPRWRRDRFAAILDWHGRHLAAPGVTT
jgi:dipeptidyl aminopeptidase/acylaminoacyl peptidase